MTNGEPTSSPCDMRPERLRGIEQLERSSLGLRQPRGPVRPGRPLTKAAWALLALLLAPPASGVRAQPQPACDRDVPLGELATQIDRADSLLAEGKAIEAKAILLDVRAQQVPDERDRTAPARCSGRLLFAIARAHVSLSERRAALRALESLAAIPTSDGLRAQGEALSAKLLAQIELLVELPAWAAAEGELGVHAIDHAPRFTLDGRVFRGWVEPGRAYELTYSAPLVQAVSRRVTTADSGRQRIVLDDLRIVLAPAADDLEGEALEAFSEGRRAAARGRWADAVDAFERAASTTTHPHVTFNLAHARMKAGDPVRARDGFVAIEQQAVPKWLKLPATAHRRRLDAEALATVTLLLPDGPAALRIDGRGVEHVEDGPSRLGASSPQPTPVGDATAIRVAVGEALRVELAEPHDVTITDGEHTRTLRRVARFELSPAPGGELTVTLRRAGAIPPAAVATDEGPSLLGPVLLGTAAVVTAGVTVAVFLAARNLRDEVRDDGLCDGLACSEAGKAKMDDAQSLADFATAGTVISTLTGAAAVGWLGYSLLSPDDGPPESALRLQIGPTGARVHAAF